MHRVTRPSLLLAGRSMLRAAASCVHRAVLAGPVLLQGGSLSTSPARGSAGTAAGMAARGASTKREQGEMVPSNWCEACKHRNTADFKWAVPSGERTGRLLGRH